MSAASMAIPNSRTSGTIIHFTGGQSEVMRAIVGNNRFSTGNSWAGR